jgi:hypothetical protein
MSEMISKGWEKMGLLRSFNMEVNTTTPLFFSHLQNPKHQEEEDDHDLDVEDSSFEIMQKYLDV